MRPSQCRTIKACHLIIMELAMQEASAANTWAAILLALIIRTIHITLGKMVELIIAVQVSRWQQVVGL